MYRILWIDDEHETFKSLKGQAKNCNINLVGFKSLVGGISELKKHAEYYDGILLDANFFETENDEAGTEDTKNVHRAKEKINQLNKQFEIFVLTAQAKAYDNETFIEAFPNIYNKANPEDIERLFSDIKTASDRQPETQLRHKFSQAFEACDDAYLGRAAEENLLSLLRVTDKNTENQLTTIRKIIEQLFQAFYKVGLLPEEFTKPKVSFNESSKFLSGKNGKNEFHIEKGYQHLEETHLPAHIANSIRNILSITQDGSHNATIDQYCKEVKNPYLFKSVLYQMMDVITWFKIYVDNNPKKSNWIKIATPGSNTSTEMSESLSGMVINVHPDNGYAFLQVTNSSAAWFIPKDLVSLFELKNGIQITAQGQEFEDKKGQKRKRLISVLEVYDKL